MWHVDHETGIREHGCDLMVAPPSPEVPYWHWHWQDGGGGQFLWGSGKSREDAIAVARERLREMLAK